MKGVNTENALRSAPGTERMLNTYWPQLFWVEYKLVRTEKGSSHQVRYKWSWDSVSLHTCSVGEPAQGCPGELPDICLQFSKDSGGGSLGNQLPQRWSLWPFSPSMKENAASTSLHSSKLPEAQWLHETKSLKVEIFVVPAVSFSSGQRMVDRVDRDCERKTMHGSLALSHFCLPFSSEVSCLSWYALVSHPPRV